MSNEIKTANADAGGNTAQEISDPSILAFEQMTVDQLKREQEASNALNSPDELNNPEPGQNTLESNLDPEIQNDQPKLDDSEEKNDDVLSQIDFDTMSEDELRELSDKLGSRAVARFGQLTAQRKQAEERLREAEALLNKQQNNPFQPEDDIAKNPYSNESDVNVLRKNFKEVSGIVEWADDILFKSHDNSPDDIVTTIEGKDMTKAEVRSTLLNAKKARDKYLPAQYKRVEQQLQNAALESQLKERAATELDWLNDDSNELKTRYDGMLADPRLETLKSSSPDLAAMLPYLISHAVNSIYGGNKKQAQPVVKNTRIDPPASPSASVMSPDKSDNKTAKAIKELRSSFNKTCSENDFIKIRALQMQSEM